MGKWRHPYAISPSEASYGRASPSVYTDMLDPDAGTVTHLGASQVAAGDGTWIRALYQASERHCAEAAREGQKLRCDPDTVAYYDKNSQDRSRGFPAVFGSCRNAHRQERITLFADATTNPKTNPKNPAPRRFTRFLFLDTSQSGVLATCRRP